MIKKRSEVQGQKQQETKRPSVPEPEPPDGAEAEERKAIQEEPPRDRREEKVDGADKPRDPSLARDGDEVTVTFGEEKFSPVQYQSFSHGGIFVKTKPRPGETLEEAGARAFAVAQAIAERTFPAKRDGFLSRLRDVGNRASSKG